MSLLLCHRILRYAAVAALLATPPSATAQVVCGDTIGPNETRVMTGHLSCNLNLNDAAITIVGPAKLDMNGFTLDCVDQEADGVVLQGDRASVSAGLIANCNDAVLGMGEGRHKVAEVGVSSPVWGFTLVSSGNRIKNSAVENFSFAGYFVAGDNNKVQDSTAGGTCDDTASTAPAFVSFGERNQFLDNLVNCRSGGPDFYGFHLDASSSQNKLIRNVVVGPRPSGGYLIEGSDHQLTKNKAQSVLVGTLVAGSGVRLTKNMLTRATTGIRSEPLASGTRGIRNATFFGTVGLRIEGTQSVLVKNVSLGHAGGFDAEDVTNCATNSWKDTVSDPAKTSSCID